MQSIPPTDSILQDSITPPLPTYSSITKENTLVLPVSGDQVHDDVQDRIVPSLKSTSIPVIPVIPLQEVIPTRKSSVPKLRPIVPTKKSPRLLLRPRVDYITLSNPTTSHVLLKDINDYIDDKKLSNFTPTVSKVLIQQMLNPLIPLHICQALKHNLCTYWIDCMYTAYDKRHNTSTLYCPILRSSIPNERKVLPPRLSFEIKITDIDHFYELKYRLCADCSRMTEGIDFENPYAPTADADALRIIISRATHHNIWL